MLPHPNKPPIGAESKASGVHQPVGFSREVNCSRKPRGSLEVFGGGSQVSALLFSRTRSAWKDALRPADDTPFAPLDEDDTFKVPGVDYSRQDEDDDAFKVPGFDYSRQDADGDSFRVLDSGDDDQDGVGDAFRVIFSGVQETTLDEQEVTATRVDPPRADSTAAPISPRNGVEDDISKWLSGAGEPVESSKPSTSSAPRSLDYRSEFLDTNEQDLDASRSRISDSSVAPAGSIAEGEWDRVLHLRNEKRNSGVSEVSDEAVSERAAQWGYGVVLKPSGDRVSGGTARSSRQSWASSDAMSEGGKGSRAPSEASSAGTNFSSIIPEVSTNVKEALATFQLAFVVCDALNPTYPILYASAGFFSMTGYTAKEVVGRNCRFLQGPYTDANDIARIREALREGNIYTGKILNYKKDGTPFWNLLTLSPIKDDAGRLIKYIGMQAEVTENGKPKTAMDESALPSSIMKKFETARQKEMSVGQKEIAPRVKPPSPGIPRPPPSAQAAPKVRAASAEFESQQSSRYSSDSKVKEARATSAEFEKRGARPAYSLSSPRDSFEAGSTSRTSYSLASSRQSSASGVDYHQTAAKLRAEVAALKAAVGNGGFNEVSEARGGSGGSTKSSKRTSSLIKLFKKLNGKFSLSRRGSRGNKDGASAVEVDEFKYEASDPEDEDVVVERKPRSSSLYSSRSSVEGRRELNSIDIARSRQNSSRSTSSYEDRRGGTSTLGDPDRMEYSTPELSEVDTPRSAMAYGRMSAQYPASEGMAQTNRHRHSIASLPPSRASINIDGKSQFCIVHPTT